MPSWLTNKHVMVVGASDGIGRELVKCLTQICSKVTAIASNRTGKLDELKKLPNIGCEISTVALDVLDDTAIKQAIIRCSVDAPIYSFVYCAGGCHIFGEFENAGFSDLDRIFDVNLKALAKWLTIILPIMRANKISEHKRGQIVLLSSRSGERPLPNLAAYAAAKGGVENLASALQKEYARDRIGFMLVNPGSVKTSFVSEWNSADAANKHNFESMAAKEVAETITYLMTRDFVVNKISFESMEQWMSEPGALV